MATIPDAVPQGALFYDAIYARGGAHGRYKDFALCKCPHCECIFLIAYERDTLYTGLENPAHPSGVRELETLYLDPDDLSRRLSIHLGVAAFTCDDCGESFPTEPWIGPDAPEAMQVTWSDLEDSAWEWTTQPPPPIVRFQPPADLAWEPELRGEPPRELPDEFRQSWFARERRTTVRFLLVFGLFCLGVALLPIMELWADILPPLHLFLWGGAAAVIGSALLNVGAINGSAGRYNYVRNGVPIAARIRSVAFGPQFNQSSEAPHRYTVQFDYIDPELAQQVREAWLADRERSVLAGETPDEPPQELIDFGLVTTEGVSDAIPLGLKDRVSMTYHEGDYVTALYLPGRLKQTIRLYGLLGLRNDLGVVFGVPVKPIGWWPIALGFSGLFGFALTMAWNYYVCRRYWPLDRPAGAFIWPLVLGALVFGALAALRWVVVAVRARRRPSQDEMFDETAVAPFGLGWLVFGTLVYAALGSFTVLCWFVTANAWFDDGAPVEHPVTLNNNPARDVTVLFVPLYRPCTMAGKFGADQRPFVHVCPPAERAALQREGGRMITQGVAEVRPGWLGWAWLDRIRTKE